MERITIPIVQIGSSKGIRIPKKILDKLGMKNTAIAEIGENSIKLSAPVAPRAGWEEDFKRCHELREDQPLIPDDLDSDLWENL